MAKVGGGNKKSSKKNQQKRIRYNLAHRGEVRRLRDLERHVARNPIDAQAHDALKRIKRG